MGAELYSPLIQQVINYLLLGQSNFFPTMNNLALFNLITNDAKLGVSNFELEKETLKKNLSITSPLSKTDLKKVLNPPSLEQLEIDALNNYQVPESERDKSNRAILYSGTGNPEETLNRVLAGDTATQEEIDLLSNAEEEGSKITAADGDSTGTGNAQAASWMRFGVDAIGGLAKAFGGGSGTENTIGTLAANKLGSMAALYDKSGISAAVMAAGSVANSKIGWNHIDLYQDQSLGTQIFGSDALGIFGVNNYNSKRFGNFSIDPTLRAELGATYSGSMKNMDYVADNISGKKIGTFDVGKMQKKWDKAVNQYQLTAGILDRANDVLARSSEMSAINHNLRQYLLLGINLLNNAAFVAKQGMKIPPEFIPEQAPDYWGFEPIQAPDNFRSLRDIEVPEDPVSNDWFTPLIAPDDYQISNILKYAKGGAFNVIPEGALHAHKHNMDIDGITKKGIPVISEDENGEILQQAEIEHSEIILRLEVTLLIEELLKEYESENTSKLDKDECAIEAGKLLVDEILYNTLDRTNLIEQV